MDQESRNIDHIAVAVHDLDAAAAAYERLGFTLTPRARHPWGTANRLVQLPRGNFIELLEVDRPDELPPHRPDAEPPEFSFGAFNRDYLQRREGFAMLVLAGQDSRADVARYRAAGLDSYAPFDFERSAPLPDGSTARVAFSLAFASHPSMPYAGFFTCHNRFPENFWKPDYMRHDNGAQEMVEVVMAAERPDELSTFLSGFSGGGSNAVEGGIAVDCGVHVLSVLEPEAARARYPMLIYEPALGPQFIAVVLNTTGPVRGPVEAGGTILDWRLAG